MSTLSHITPMKLYETHFFVYLIVRSLHISYYLVHGQIYSYLVEVDHIIPDANWNFL